MKYWSWDWTKIRFYKLYVALKKNANIFINVVTYLWSSNDEQSTWINVNDSLLIEVLVWNDLFDDLLFDFPPEVVQRYFFTVLNRYDDGVYSSWNAGSVVKRVFGSNLKNKRRSEIV